MHEQYFSYNGFDVAMIGKSGSSAISSTIALKLNPTLFDSIADPERRALIASKVSLHAAVPNTHSPTAPIVLVRDSVERFRSACAQEDLSADAGILKAGSTAPGFHFKKTSDYLRVGAQLYRFPADFNAVGTLLGLGVIPVVNDASTSLGQKPDLTAIQIDAVKAIYADDVALYASISAPGQVYAPPVVEPAPVNYIPLEVPLWAFREVVFLDDLLEAPYNALMSTLKIQDARLHDRLKNFIDFGNFVQRDSASLLTLAAGLGKNATYIDSVFVRAATKKL